MKTVIIIIIASVSMFSCNTQQSNSNKNIEIVNQYFNHFNNHEWEQMAAMYSATAEFKDPSLGQGIIKQTQEDIIEKYKGLNEVFPDIKDEIIQVYPSGENNIIIEFISTGTAPDGSAFALPICTIFTIENGLITKDFSYFDNFEE